MGTCRVAVQGTDVLSTAGLVGLLQSRPGLTVVGAGESADVRVVVAPRVSAQSVALLRDPAGAGDGPVVLVVDEVSGADLFTAVGCRVVAIVPRATATGERLAYTVTAAAHGGAVLPPHLVGELLKQLERLQRTAADPRGTGRAGLTPREVDILRLLADGLDTQEIAGRLCYSERTVKNIVYGMTHRMRLRNRSHAVAYAVRAGVI